MDWLVCVLLFLCQVKIQGAELIHRFVKTGSDVTLDITDPGALKNYIALQWKFNTSRVLVTAQNNEKPTTHTDRVLFHPKNFSLTLKNLQKEHSGLYEPVLVISGDSPIMSAYNITAQDPVSRVSMTVDSVSLSPDSCNFTVSCRPESSSTSSVSQSFTCGRHTCDPTPEDHTLPLRLYVSNVSVICNHSNHVSWFNATKGIEEVCSEEQHHERIKGGITGGIIGLIIVLCLAVLAVGAIPVAKKIRGNKRIMKENTVYDQALSPLPVPDTERPDTIYSEVQPHSAPPPPEVQNTESIYATVNKPQTPDLLTSTT